MTVTGNHGKLYFVAEHKIFATVAQPVEQLTRNEQVVRSNRISSSKILQFYVHERKDCRIFYFDFESLAKPQYRPSTKARCRYGPSVQQRWCYADGEYMCSDMDDLIDVCVKNMVSEEYPEENVRSYLKLTLPKLDYWKRYKELGGNKAFEEFKKLLIEEINALNIEGMPKLTKLNALVGSYINLEYKLPNGRTVKYLNDQTTYLGNQLECEFGGSRCFGIVANMEFILICTYEENGENPELLIYKKR